MFTNVLCVLATLTNVLCVLVMLFFFCILLYSPLLSHYFLLYLQEVDPSKESSPLGLTLTKTPSFIDLVEMKLSQTRSKSCSIEKHQALVQETKTDNFVPQPMSDREKLKASNFPALLLKIGSWEVIVSS